MILTMTEMYSMAGGRYSIIAYGAVRFWIMERAWDFNRSGTGVPKDEYRLERHNGGKYKDTWALIGDGVSHFQTPGIPRFACVIHPADYPSNLKGCLAAALGITAQGTTIDSDKATAMLLADLDREDSHTILVQ